MHQLFSVFTFYLSLSSLALAQDLDEYLIRFPYRGTVSDFAFVLNDTEEIRLQQQADSLSQTGRIRYALCTVTTLAGFSPKEVTARLRETWELGGSNGKNGVLILLAQSERKLYVSTGSMVKHRLPNDTVQQIVNDYILPWFRGNQYYKGLTYGLAKLHAASQPTLNYSSDRTMPWWLLILLAILLPLRLLFRKLGIGSGSGGGPTFSIGDGGGNSSGGGSSGGGSDGGGGGGGGDF
ncbi:MAG TPA: hypothetical protein DCE41_33720 [Cytophagales bacterium]|nr:hypothetical protein [Cytophagales bacterium]HAA19308.1 hypothetical protein [Cytophagales bacterium]HAP60086.1 hypothetical protein [Cytophagales bacterium]